MLAIGMVILCLGIIGLVFGVFQKMKAGRVADAPLASTGDVARRGREVAGPKGQISAQGAVACAQPLVSPVTGQPCLYFKVKCTGRWKDGDTQKSKVVDEQKMAASFSIDDGSGPIFVDAREGGDFEPTQTKRESKGAGLGGIIGKELVFGQYRVASSLPVGTSYEVEEEILPMVPRLYACGKLGDNGAIAAPGWRQLIMSSKSREELLASSTKTAKMALIAGAAAFVVGSGLAAVGQFVMNEGAPSAATTTTTGAKVQ